MTGHEKKLLTEQHEMLTASFDRMHEAWRSYTEAVTAEWAQITQVRGKIAMILAVSEIAAPLKGEFKANPGCVLEPPDAPVPVEESTP